MNSRERYKIDERKHVELPFLEQLQNLGWGIVDLTGTRQTPGQTWRENFAEVFLYPVLQATKALPYRLIHESR